MSESFIAATANTHEGRMLHDPAGFQPMVANGVDVILMQEVLRISQDELRERLSLDNYQLGHFDSASGLAIAVSVDSSFQPVAGSARTEVIQPPEKIGELIRSLGVPMWSRLRQRGLISLQVASAKRKATVVDTHPIVFLRWLARAKQVEDIGGILTEPHYQEDPLVVGADMNHYPSPAEVDLCMRAEAELSAVEFTEPTWRIRGSKHQWAFDAELDVLLYRGLMAELGILIDISSDHRAAAAKFTVQ